MKNIAVILTGCGSLDGSEVTEAVSALVALSEMKAKYQCFAPNAEITPVDYVTGETQTPAVKRNALKEAARICRGNVQDIHKLFAKDFDGLVLPGGYGAAQVLADWGQKGAACTVQPEVVRIVRDFNKSAKPIVAICISPAIIAKVLGDKAISVTVGHDKETIAEIRKTGAQHIECPVTDFITDRENKIITTPAYMYSEATPFEVFSGIRKAIKELCDMA